MEKTKLNTYEQDKYDTIRSCSDGDITNKEASIRLGISIRQIQRLKRAVEEYGEQGIIHGLKGKVAHNVTNEIVVSKVTNFLKENKHIDFGPTFAKEKLINIGVNKSVETIRRVMIKNNIWKSKKRYGPEIHREWRERMSMYGELVQFDGSYHDWFENGKEQCLLGSIDDATGNIVKAVFEDNEGVKSCFRFWKAYVETYGRPVAIYLDKFSTYKINHKDAVNNEELMTQFGRAMKELNIRVICANSPQAKGRVERLFGTLQDRLIKEMRLEDVRDRNGANRFLEKKYIPDHNKRFSVIPRSRDDAHRPLTNEMIKRLSSIFSRKSERKVNNDYTISFRANWYQLSNTQNTTIYRGDSVLVEEHLDDTLHVFKNNISLGYIKLPERPKKIEMKVTALTRNKPQWKPPASHPWRRDFFKR